MFERSVSIHPEAGPLSRKERLHLINSILSGIGQSPNFDENVLKTRIINCILLAEQMINVRAN